MVTGEWGEVTFAGQATLVPRGGVVQVAAGGGPAAARGGAGGVAGADQVLEFAAGPVAGLGAGVVAGTPGDGGERGGEDAPRPGGGRRVAVVRWSSAGWSGAGWGVAAGEAGVGGGGAV